MEITSKSAVRNSNRSCVITVSLESFMLIDLNSYAFISKNSQNIFSLFRLVLDHVVVHKGQVFSENCKGELKISLVY